MMDMKNSLVVLVLGLVVGHRQQLHTRRHFIIVAADELVVDIDAVVVDGVFPVKSISVIFKFSRHVAASAFSHSLRVVWWYHEDTLSLSPLAPPSCCGKISASLHAAPPTAKGDCARSIGNDRFRALAVAAVGELQANVRRQQRSNSYFVRWPGNADKPARQWFGAQAKLLSYRRLHVCYVT